MVIELPEKTTSSTSDATANSPAITYLIKAGSHETTNPFKLLRKSQVRFVVTFDSSAVYRSKDTDNQADINKLYGMSDFNTFHQTNSARFGWRWYNNRLELMAYSYKNGVNSSDFITALELNKPYTCTLTLSDQKYIYQVEGQTTSVEQSRRGSGIASGYQLYPYFGGDETAPHDVRIKIQELP
ncbi:hypothetical protein [Hymenobacter crusticola]|nr:hypothetical protein [Hymenobacter crusticola]